ncbi:MULTISPECIES: hypothetical protein [Ensifer]|uniref:hypothetical protein n=1 Tax=Ensifer TaxID=106591 RepID=UPI0007144772|nr:MULTISPECIES: hypothetical protein [Ensifer]KQX78097.1 hypothetical protein ASD41_34165 [Ensifer sp. Root1312]KRD63485.1 hypothetical protein ASE71_31495 [Ensifer sp. Root954]UTV38583.1 hypothetical protein MYG64_09880 [Ensifer adhaerens]
MQYTLWNTVRVLVCYAVMLLVAKLLYGRFFQWYMAPYATTYFLVAFVPLHTVSLRNRVLLITVFMLLTIAARAFHWAFVADGTFDSESFVRGLFLYSLHSWIGPDYLVFVLTYVFLENRLVRRFCPAVP